MHSINTPLYTFADAYTRCTERTQSTRQAAFNAKMGDMVSLCQLYDRKMAEHGGHEIVPMTDADVAPLTLDIYRSLYDDKLLNSTLRGRKVYDDLLAAGLGKGCCYCSYGEVSELDHLLPNSRYAEYVIYPKNLVPSCHRCNDIKDAFWPRTQPDNLIHPYFEDYSEYQWLAAEVVFLHGWPTVRYWVRHDGFEDATIPVRIENQFNRLELPARFGSQAAREINTRSVGTFRSTFRADGRQGLEDWVLNEYHDQFRADKNSWKTACYRAFRESHQFCEFQWAR